MKTITTKYLLPTERHGGRIKATDNDGNSVTIDYPHEISGQEEKHCAAAMELCGKMGWTGTMVGGYIKGCQFAFVWIDAAGRSTYHVGG